ncbi:hypothetical protein AB0F85_13510 [Nocardia fluminea]
MSLVRWLPTLETAAPRTVRGSAEAFPPDIPDSVDKDDNGRD